MLAMLTMLTVLTVLAVLAHAYHTYQQLFAQVHGPVIRRQLEDGYVAFHRAGTSVADTSI